MGMSTTVSKEMLKLLLLQERQLSDMCDDCLKFSEYAHADADVTAENKIHGEIVRQMYTIIEKTQRFRDAALTGMSQCRVQWDDYKEVTAVCFELYYYISQHTDEVSVFRKKALLQHSELIYNLARQQAFINLKFGWAFVNRVLER